MGKLNLIKSRIKSVSSTLKITKTMDMVARSQASKLLVYEQGMRPYTQKMNRIVEELSMGNKDDLHILQIPKSNIKRVAIFIITSTRGLCGSYNSRVFDLALERIRHHKRRTDNREIELHIIGRKGEVYFEKQGFDIYKAYSDIDENVTFDYCEDIMENFMKDYAHDRLSRVEVIYTRYYTRVVHIPKVQSLIPIVDDEEDVEVLNQKIATNYIVEPNARSILDEVIPVAIKNSFYFMIINSILSENAERAVAMRNATENAQKMLLELKKKANKARQENITNELLDIIGGSEALSK